ncbi:MAG: undecaprenyl/decaprenyl-phosphate alpha-N-acetylglucosaminyl 1-phosphate transferase [Acidobacteria bacterium]|nr:undecaprenyl/decaprenyl-phosphate alpha-N-acetylglucosaminyl 1-phosphate transferase [Acidobacteriota bacterium]
MPLIWAIALTAFIFSILLSPVCSRILALFGVLDQPDQRRKLHSVATPRGGGIAVVAASAAALLVWLPETAPQTALIRQIAPGALAMFLVGLADDLTHLAPWGKLAGQTVAAGLACAAGIRIGHVGGVAIENTALSVVLTILWLLICTNAFNLVDGLDGLAAGVGMFSTATALAAALIFGLEPLGVAAAPLLGALAGFLVYNFNPATIFLGDSGSLVLGFCLGCFAIFWSGKTATLLQLLEPLMALSLPLADTVLSILRRLARRQPIFMADRGHVHHRLLDRGLSPRNAVLAVYAFCGLAAVLALVQSVVTDARYALLNAMAFACALWTGFRFLRYTELSWPGREGRKPRLTVLADLRIGRKRKTVA